MTTLTTLSTRGEQRLNDATEIYREAHDMRQKISTLMHDYYLAHKAELDAIDDVKVDKRFKDQNMVRLSDALDDFQNGLDDFQHNLPDVDTVEAEITESLMDDRSNRERWVGD